MNRPISSPTDLAEEFERIGDTEKFPEIRVYYSDLVKLLYLAGRNVMHASYEDFYMDPHVEVHGHEVLGGHSVKDLAKEAKERLAHTSIRSDWETLLETQLSNVQESGVIGFARSKKSKKE